MIPSDNRTAPTCNIFTRELLSRIGDKWSILIIAHLSEGPLRFNMLRRTIGQVSQRMLTLTLRSLERDGLVLRTVFPSVPPRVEYELTPLGRTLMGPVMTLIDWSLIHQGEVEKARSEYESQPEFPTD
ncbi:MULTISPECIES: winged helix-turn-helix transcriptional regulator [Klebsiella]|uniref:winged helix-turn-helix transcriptional regulator n=1 Tax=Klebsiella TaxID=570 RepID=UPI0009079C49|nr:helix-turn-helix domain-containing protein [Klebsiella pneumoniae]HBY0541942.1 transcriptional regulator [Klebsiella pneumoniae subsp. pneumoniae]HDT5554546.1 helix-turn-helix transcriptional regulator [Klebsiella pneumoniae subsp. ozaenae]EIV7917065.1 helix-turn-helix transcriptional regulator [Klebsiella pneumoniae]EIX9390880.1 helix-turn-helix transcriptional regulator [Klebsiella pneumoniae]EKU8801408.1 helix-turn-helix transcriptional regulator [Klebsiella pneumoniae]